MISNEMIEKQLQEQIGDLLADPVVGQMKRFKAHGHKSVYDHSLDVARMACRLDDLLGKAADQEVLLKGALLHDFYLYDWHEARVDVPLFQMHGFTHPKKAADNAARYFAVDEKVQKVIRCHMWPLTLRDIPSSREAFIVCLADKLCALKETLQRW